jgi:hypothetical protein
MNIWIVSMIFKVLKNEIEKEKPFLLLKEKYVRHEHLLWIVPIVKFLYNSFSIILCFLCFFYIV